MATECSCRQSDREAIRDLMDRYCLSLLRSDSDQLLSIYWPGAHEEHGEYSGPVEGFVEQFAPKLRERISTVATLRYQEISFVSDTEAKADGFGHITVITESGGGRGWAAHHFDGGSVWLGYPEFCPGLKRASRRGIKLF
jgi:SnoaL-like domain